MLILTLIAATVGCATNSKSRWLLIGAAAPVGGAVGYATAPKDEKKEAHALLWSALFGLGAAVVGNYVYNDDARVKQLESENEQLKNIPKFELISEKEAYFTEGGSNGEKKKYKVKTKKIDVWLDDGPNKKYHQDMVIERVAVPEEVKKSDGK